MTRDGTNGADPNIPGKPPTVPIPKPKAWPAGLALLLVVVVLPGLVWRLP